MQIKSNLPVLLIFAIFLIFATSSLSARDLYSAEGIVADDSNDKSLSDPFVTIRYHNLARMGFSVTNMGQLGLWGEVWMDPLNPSEEAESLEFPLESTETHLFGGAIWVGAVVDGDTLVSVGADGWFQTQEMWPESYPLGDMAHLSIDNGDPGAVSNQDFIAKYTDTLIDPAFVHSDPIDGRPHIPLGIEVTQKSYAWEYPYATDFVIVEYSIKNIGTNYLEDVYLGILWDGDVFSGSDLTGYSDDITGYRESAVVSNSNCPLEVPINLAYIIDNNGRGTSEVCPYVESSPNDGVGITVLQSPGAANVNFNWWVSSANAALDFGPRKAGTSEDPFFDFGGQLGTPTGDRSKYYIMSHPEVDYDQLFTAVDHTADGWLPPPTNALNIAHGFDTRYLLSTGGIDLAPGESIPFVFAVVGGESIHSDCDAYDNILDLNNPAAYYNTFDFGDIGMNALYASWVFDNPGVDTDGDAYYGEYFVCCIDSEFVGGQWECTVADTFYYTGDGVPDLRGFHDMVNVSIDETQLHWADGNIVAPEVLTITLEDVSLDFVPSLVDVSTVQVNGITAENVTVSSMGSNDALVVEVDKASFVSGYGTVWDNELYEYHVTGAQTDGFTFDYVGTVNIQGHISGDVNMDNRQNVLDVIYLIQYKMHDGPPPIPLMEAGDVDGSGTVDIIDIMYYIDYLFRDGPALRHP